MCCFNQRSVKLLSCRLLDPQTCPCRQQRLNCDMFFSESVFHSIVQRKDGGERTIWRVGRWGVTF